MGGGRMAGASNHGDLLRSRDGGEQQVSPFELFFDLVLAHPGDAGLQPSLAETQESSAACVPAECAHRWEISGESYSVFDYKPNTMQSGRVKGGASWPS